MRSIRVRLTIWYFTILAVILLLFGVGIYFTLRKTLSDNFDEALQTRAASLASAVEYDASGRPSPDLAMNGNDPSLQDSYERIFDANGQQVFDNSRVFGAGPPDQQTISRALSGGEQIATLGDGETEARLITRRLVVDGRTAGVLQIGQATLICRTMKSAASPGRSMK